jgi:endonuclease YncB( thermonuclease family)
MSGRNPINPLSIMFVLGVLAYGVYNGWIDKPQFLSNWSFGPVAKPPGTDSPGDPRTNPPTGPPAQPGGTAGDELEKAPQPMVISGPVVAVLDGDTIEVLVEQRQLRIRLDGIDAPEREQPFSRAARDFLGELCHRQTAYIMVVAKDRYDRLVGDVYLEGVWINGEMVKAGYAWHYTQYNDSAELAALQQAARDARRGLWADAQALPPWEFRAAQR